MLDWFFMASIPVGVVLLGWLVYRRIRPWLDLIKFLETKDGKWD